MYITECLSCYVLDQLCLALLKFIVEEFTITPKELKVNSAHFIGVSSRRSERLDQQPQR